MKERIRSNLEILEKEQIVSRRDNYQTLVNFVVQVRVREHDRYMYAEMTRHLCVGVCN